MRGGRKSGRNSYCNRAQPFKNPGKHRPLHSLCVCVCVCRPTWSLSASAARQHPLPAYPACYILLKSQAPSWPAQTMPPNLTGYYCFVSQKNMEDYLQALNINMALRKIVLLLKPDKEIDHQGNHMIVKTLSTFRNYILEFEVGVEFEEDLRIVDGRKCQTIVTWEEEQLVCVQKGEVPNRGWRHWLEGEKLYLELTARDAVCEQVFRKVK